jgi:acetolactate synthase-1/2/3 large subunit
MSLRNEDTMTTELIDLDGLLPDGMRLMASCFDANHTIGGGLFAINGSVEDIDRVSSAGLVAADGRLYRCLWSADGSPAELVVYDETGVCRYHRLDGVSTPHDILVVDGNVLVVATMQNEVHCVTPSGEVAWRWRAPGEPDSWHLNSITQADGRVVVCGFGQFLRQRGWDEAGKPDSGRVIDLETGNPVLDGLHAPHNPLRIDNGWLVCDSAAGELLEIPDETGEVGRRLSMPGWPRGLVASDDYLYVGLSPHRHAATTVETAAVAVVDRSNWSLIGVVKLPAREVYALALASEDLAAGARHGFGANQTRVHEQGQRQLFDELGVQPRRLWSIGDPLIEEERQAAITIEELSEDAEAGGLLTVSCLIRNTGTGILTPAPPYPVRVVHSWHDANGDVAGDEAKGTALIRSLPPDGFARMPLRIRVPEQAGQYRLRITLAQDGGRPFSELDKNSMTEKEITVVSDQLDARPLARFGLHYSEIRDARASASTVEDVVASLLTRPTGGPHGLPIALIQDLGRDAFVQAVADTLHCSPNAVDHVVNDALPRPEDVLLTGAEAIAVSLWRAGVRVAFAYAGTSELVMCDAFARLGLLVNGRGDKEALFEAGGASRLRPGNGAALLHGARGLTNAMGALADLRRNEAGTVAVVGLPSSGSAPFLPPHGEPGLIQSAGDFAKTWFELKAVPSDDDERAAAVQRMAWATREAVVQAVTPPYGPVLLAIPQDVAEASWVPLVDLPEMPDIDTIGDVRPDPDAVRQAGDLVASASRPAVLVDDYALVHDGIRDALDAFCERTGAPVLQVKYRRGAMLFERLRGTELPNFLGWYDPGDTLHQSIMDNTDLLITLEDRNMYPRVVGELPDCRKIALTTKPSAVEKNEYLGDDDVLVQGNPVTALLQLADRGTAMLPWCTRNTAVSPGAPPPAVPEPAAVIRSGIATTIRMAADKLNKPAILVDDSQMFGGMLAEEYELLPEGLRVFGGHGGFVGGGIAQATGLQVGEPSTKVFCCVGDQGFTNGIQGLVAAVQESAPITFIVCNNGGSVSLRKQSNPSGWLDATRHQYLENADGANYTAVASALGLDSRRIDLSDWLDGDESATRLDTFAVALDAVAGHPGPTLIELVLPSDPEFWSGVWITSGFEQASKPEPASGGGHA